MNVRYTHRNNATSPNEVVEILEKLYQDDPWIIDGKPHPMMCWTQDDHPRHHGTAYGEFKIEFCSDQPVITGEGQQHAFERLIDDLMQRFCETRAQWRGHIESFDFSVHVSYITAEWKIYRSSLV